MANEIAYTAQLQIRNGATEYRSSPSTFNADQATAETGPVPGTVAATTAGVNVDLSGLSVPGFCFLQNLDADNYVTYGIFAGATFYPLGELLAGEHNVLRLSRTIVTSNNFRLVANTATVNVLVQAHEA